MLSLAYWKLCASCRVADICTFKICVVNLILPPQISFWSSQKWGCFWAALQGAEWGDSPNSAAAVPSPPLYLKSFTPRENPNVVQDSIPESRKSHPSSPQELCAAADLGFCKSQISPARRGRFQALHMNAVTCLTNFGTKSCSAELRYFSKTFWDGNREGPLWAFSQ